MELNGVNCMSIIVYDLLSVRISSEVCFSLKGCESFVKLFDAEQALKREREGGKEKQIVNKEAVMFDLMKMFEVPFQVEESFWGENSYCNTLKQIS